MTHHELEQQLWELEYGLLPDEEAAVLRDRLATEPELAALQKRVRSRREWVAHAARIDAPPMSFDPASQEPVNALPQNAPNKFARLANWSMAIAASLLLGLIAWNAVPETNREVAELSPAQFKNVAIEQPVFVKIDMPAKLSTETTNTIAFRAENSEGTPQAAELEVRLLDRAGKKLGQTSAMTDARGRFKLGLTPVDSLSVAQAQVSMKNLVGPTVNLEFVQSEPAYVTHLVTDKPRYHPGDAVRFRSTTVTRFGLRADREHEVDYRVTDPNGQELPNAKQTDTTQTGVGSGELTLAEDAVHGRYSLFAASTAGTLPEVRRDFDVTVDAQREYDLDVQWTAERFASGEAAVGELLVTKLDGQPAANENVELRGYVDGQQAAVEPVTATLDAEGKAKVRVTLPEQIASTVGDFGIVVAGRATVWKEIPLRADQAQVDFYPEGGDLVAGVESRVYFASHDHAGKPVALRGRLTENGGQPIADLQAVHGGLGSFRFTPAAGVAYSVAVDDPPGIKSSIALPSVAANANVVLDAREGVFAEQQPLTVNLRARETPPELVVAAYCRGVTVGQQSVSPADFSAGRCEVTLPITDEAAGVLRVTVFDYSKQPPEPLAERLVYRRPAKKLAVRWDAATPSATNTTSLSLQTVDEAGRPLSAVLGLAIIDDAVLLEALPNRRAPRIDAQFLLLGDVDHPEQLEDASFYLSDQVNAAEALDLLLGTQGWRRFERIPASRLAQVDLFKQEQFAFRQVERKEVADGVGIGFVRDETERRNRTLGEASNFYAEVTDEAPRRVASVFVGPTKPLRERSAVTVDQPSSPQTTRRRPNRWLNLLGGSALSLVLLIAAFVRWRPRRRIWLPALVVAGLLGGFGYWFIARSAIQNVGRVSAQPPATYAAPSAGADLEALPQLAEHQLPMVEEKLGGMGGMRGMAPLSGSQPADPITLNRRSGTRDDDAAALAPARARTKNSPAPTSQPPPGPAGARSLLAPVADPAPVANNPSLGRKQDQLYDVKEKPKLVRRFAIDRDKKKEARGKAATETLYWNPRLITDADGRAVIQFPTPTPARPFRVLLDAHQDGRVFGTELTR